jgi:hypothetical protein
MTSLDLEHHVIACSSLVVIEVMVKAKVCFYTCAQKFHHIIGSTNQPPFRRWAFVIEKPLHG